MRTWLRGWYITWVIRIFHPDIHAALTQEYNPDDFVEVHEP